MANLIPLAIADLELQVTTAISVGDESFSINASVDDDGVSLPAGKYCFTLDSGTSNKEYLIGQLNGTSITSVKSVSRQGVETTGAARAHRVGAPCIVTNFATLQRVADILRGELTLDGSAPIIYDAEPTLADRKEMATVGYVLDTVTGGTVAFDTQTTAGNAGETVAAGDLVYFKTSDQEWYLTDADTAATVEGVQLGIALGSGTDGVAISGGIQISGTYTTTGLTAGSIYYAGNTAGAYTTTEGTTPQAIGVALSTTKLLMIPRNPQTVTTAEKTLIASIEAGTYFPTPQVVTFTSSGTWTKDAGLKYIIAEVQAPGGGSSYLTDNNVTKSAPSGGGGGYGKKLILASALGSTETITIGAVGAAGSFGSTSGTAGGTTSFGSIISATGGGGATTTLGGSGGGVTGGDLNIPGGDGGFDSSTLSPTAGGGSFLSPTSSTRQDRATAAAGKSYGGGAHGAADGSQSDRNGAAGGPGIVIVTEYYS